MRTFIAIELPAEIKEYLNFIQNKLKACQTDMKWVKPENIHLTLKFLGEINAEQFDKTVSILKKAADNNPSFKINMASIAAFPGINTPRIIWLGINQGEPQIKTLVANLEEKLVGIGIPAEERTFSVHITIARTCSCRNQQSLGAGIAGLNDKLKIEKHEFTADKLTLFKSTLTSQGPLYEALQVFPLGDGSS